MAESGDQLYEQLMRFRPEGLSPNAWAVKAGVSRTIWQDLRRHGNPSRRTLEKLLAAAGSSLAEFEALRVGQISAAGERDVQLVGEGVRGFRGAGLPAVPVIWSQAGGEWGRRGSGVTMVAVDGAKVLDRINRLSSLMLDHHAYALAVPDNAMWPRFRPGRNILVSPKATVEPGDDVLVKIAQGGTHPPLALLKYLEGRSGNALQLRQFTPDVSFEVRLDQIELVHKVLGELI